MPVPRIPFPAFVAALALGGCSVLDPGPDAGKPAPAAQIRQPMAQAPAPAVTAAPPPAARIEKPPAAAIAPAPAPKPPPAVARAPAPKPKPAAVAPTPAPVAAAPAAPPRPAAPPPLDLGSLEQRLKATEAIGVLTKLSLKNQVDDIIDRFKAFHAGHRPPTLTELKPAFNLLLMKVLSLLQDKDAALARDIDASRDALWGVLCDRDQLSKYASR